MNMKNLTVLATLLPAAAGAVTFTVDKVQQRYPWNGMVDIDYSVAYADGETPLDPVDDKLVFTFVDESVTPFVSNVVKYAEDTVPTVSGSYRATWDANLEGVTWRSDKVRMLLGVKHYARKYMVIDLSEGPTATSYPVTYMSAPPATDAGFNCTEYKTTKMVFRLIPPGTFRMGSMSDEVSRGENETRHLVTLTKSFYIGLFELTQAQYANVRSLSVSDYATYAGEERPVDRAMYKNFRCNCNADIPASGLFIKIMRTRAGLNTFDLPTEAQWEYACRAGTVTPLNDGVPCTTSEALESQAKVLGRCKANKDDKAGGYDAYTQHTVVGLYAPNKAGLYDMHGNVAEMCLDIFRADISTSDLRIDPLVPNTWVYNTDAKRPLRGGGFNRDVSTVRSAARVTGDTNSNTDSSYGYRLAVTLP